MILYLARFLNDFRWIRNQIEESMIKPTTPVDYLRTKHIET